MPTARPPTTPSTTSSTTPPTGRSPGGAADNAFAAFRYPDGNGAGSLSIPTPAGAAAGSYELRLFSNNVYTLLATSNSFAVQTPPPASLSAAPSSVYSSQSVT